MSKLFYYVLLTIAASINMIQKEIVVVRVSPRLMPLSRSLGPPTRERLPNFGAKFDIFKKN